MDATRKAEKRAHSLPKMKNKIKLAAYELLCTKGLRMTTCEVNALQLEEIENSGR